MERIAVLEKRVTGGASLRWARQEQFQSDMCGTGSQQ
jgi:hypothetical protein